MIDYADRPNRWPWPPMILVGTLISGFALGYVAPFSLLGGLPATYASRAGWVLVATALLIDLAAMFTMWRHKTQILPHKAADNLVTSGPFAFSRNPIYVGNTLLIFGIGLISSEPWLVLLAVPASFAVQKLAVEREERHMAALFGAAWVSYTKRVRRWL